MKSNVWQRTFFRKFAAIALSLLLGQPVYSQSSENQQIVFEGSLTDASGNAIDLSSASLTFYISANGCYLYGETTSAAGDSLGNILHRIGSGAQISGSPNSFSQNLFFGAINGTTTFAGNNCSVTGSDTRLAQVYYPAQSITATIQLGTVPYARNATMLSGKSVNSFVQVSADSNTLFSGGADGQFLTKTSSGLTWTTFAASTVTSATVNSALGYVPANSATLSNYSQKANNLSDLTSSATARANLGLGSFATKSALDISTSEVFGILPAHKLQSPALTGDVEAAAGSSTVTVTQLRGVALSPTMPTTNQVLTYSGGAWVPMTPALGSTGISNLTAGQGLLGGIITSTGTLSVNFGSTSGTVAAGDDARIVQAMIRGNNLTDLTSPSIARGALGLGSFATKSSVDLATADVTGVLPIANGGTAWTSSASGIYTTSNTAIGAGSLPGWKFRVYSDTVSAATITNMSATGVGLSIATGGGTGLLVYTPSSSSTTPAIQATNVSGTTFVVQSNGRVGIGVDSPTALLHLGSASTNLAQLKLNSGLPLTNPQSGTIENDGTNLYYTDDSNVRRTIATGNNINSLDNLLNINSPSTLSLSPAQYVIVSATAASVNSNTGALVVKGGVGVAGNINAAGSIQTQGVVSAAGIGYFYGGLNTSGTLNAAGNINTLGNIYASGNISNNGSISTLSSLNGASLYTPNIFGSTGAGQNLFIESTSHTTKGNILIAPNGGNVGIGTNSPTYRLNVRSPATNSYVAGFSPFAGSSFFGVGEDAGGQMFTAYHDAAGVSRNFITANGTNYFMNDIAIGSQLPMNGSRLTVSGATFLNGNVGVSRTITLYGGSSVSAPLVFASTALVGGTPAQGSVEFNGWQLFYTDAFNTRRRLAGGVSSGTIDNVNKIGAANSQLTLEGFSNSMTGAVVFNNTGAGGVAIQANANVNVTGSIKLAADGSNTAANCTAAEEGKQRYNSNHKTMEFCDGAYWNGINGPTHCATQTIGYASGVSYTLIGRPGTGNAFCMSRNNEYNAYENAVEDCNERIASNGSRMYMCTAKEYFQGCKVYGSIGAEAALPGYRSSTAYWTDSIYSVGPTSMGVFVFGSGTAGVCDTNDKAEGSVFETSNANYRCCWR